MAKQIKAIKCPHCGSVEKTKLDKDLYHCENCNTDYFLDNDDININVNNRVEYSTQSYFVKNKTLYIVLTVIISFLVIGYMFIRTLSHNSNDSSNRGGGTYTTSTVNISASKPEPIAVPKPITYTQSNKIFYVYPFSASQVYSFNISYRTFDNQNKDRSGIYYEIRDIKTGAVIKSELLQTNDGDRDKWSLRRFDNNITYIVYNDSKVYAFDEQGLNVVDVTHSLVKDRPELVSGIASINLTPWGYEDSFYILTNNGQEYFYYPLLNRLYNYKTDYQELNKYFDSLTQKREETDEPYDRTSYVFEKFGDSRANATLIKVVYKTNNISKFDSFGLSSTNDPDKPYKINLQYREGPIIEDNILAKDRIFFDPTIIYSNKDELIIRVKNNASPKSYYNLQSLDTNTGNVKWTIKGDKNIDFWSNSSSSGNLDVWSKYNLESSRLFIPYADGYIVQLGYGNYVVISKQGEMSSMITYEPEKIQPQVNH